MKDKDYLKHIKEVTGSDTLCAAKWYNATIWLGSGQTTSCHHPPAHQIDTEELKTNPKALHNTAQKKDDRVLMVKGERPKGCDYCWKVEDMKSDQISDRVYKSKIYDDNALIAASKSGGTDVNLKTLEISFDRTCQFACSYCNPAFSTTWAKDINDNGPYTDLLSDGRNHFTHSHDASQKFNNNKEDNPYIKAFWQWWESDLRETLQELRVTGGEPLMSPEFWKLLDKYKANEDTKLLIRARQHLDPSPYIPSTGDPVYYNLPRLAVNSNLGCSEQLFDRLMMASRDVPDFDLYTSCESTFAEAEYIRDGLDYGEWYGRMDDLASYGGFNAIHVMCTINALSLFSLTDFLDSMLMLKRKFGRDFPNFTLNILRFPSFQSCLVLPEEIRKTRRQDLQLWYWKNAGDPMLHPHELNHVERLIEYLNEPEPEDVQKLRHDFKSFYTQYDKRRGKDFNATFSKEITEWYKKI